MIVYLNEDAFEIDPIKFTEWVEATGTLLKETLLHIVETNEAQTIATQPPSTDYTTRWLLEQSIKSFLETHTTEDLEEIVAEYQ